MARRKRTLDLLVGVCHFDVLLCFVGIGSVTGVLKIRRRCPLLIDLGDWHMKEQGMSSWDSR